MKTLYSKFAKHCLDRINCKDVVVNDEDDWHEGLKCSHANIFISPYVFHKINGKYTRNIVYLKVNDDIDKLKKYINNSKYHEICVNDVETTEIENKLRLREILDEYYPEKSMYET